MAVGGIAGVAALNIEAVSSLIDRLNHHRVARWPTRGVTHPARCGFLRRRMDRVLSDVGYRPKRWPAAGAAGLTGAFVGGRVGRSIHLRAGS